MHPSLRIGSLVVGVAWVVTLVTVWPLGMVAFGQAQEATATIVWVQLVNEIRLDEGLDPYSQSRLLTNAAQRHADDLAEHGFVDPDNIHLGSDDSDEQERIEEAGYAAWTRNGDRMVVAENVWSGQGDPHDALTSFLDDQTYRDNLLSDIYREMGVGATTDADGRAIYVLVLGARPNVLPVFVNDGADSTENREVAIRLTNERVRPEGEGATFMGEAIEIRISNEPSFEELTWQPWAPLVSWLLPDTPGEHTVYVQFRDAAGRTAASADGIFLGEETPVTSSAVPSTSTRTARAPDATAPLGPTSESIATQGVPTTMTPVAVATLPSSTASPLVARATPFPTWTPLPSPEFTPTSRDDPDAGVLSPPKVGEYGRLLAIVGVLHGVVIILGVCWLMRRGGRG